MTTHVLGSPGSSRTERTRHMVTAALIAALISASAWVSIPLGAVPVTLQVFFVVLAALLLSPLWAGASMAVYLALGAAGLPVFSGAQGGLGVLAGPTGGYLLGFLLAVVAGSFARARLSTRIAPEVDDALTATVVIVVVYAVGAAQLGAVLDLSPTAAFVAGVAPFVGPDLAKAIVAVAAAAAIRRARGY